MASIKPIETYQTIFTEIINNLQYYSNNLRNELFEQNLVDDCHVLQIYRADFLCIHGQSRMPVPTHDLDICTQTELQNLIEPIKQSYHSP